MSKELLTHTLAISLEEAQDLLQGVELLIRPPRSGPRDAYVRLHFGKQDEMEAVLGRFKAAGFPTEWVGPDLLGQPSFIAKPRREKQYERPEGYVPQLAAT